MVLFAHGDTPWAFKTYIADWGGEHHFVGGSPVPAVATVSVGVEVVGMVHCVGFDTIGPENAGAFATEFAVPLFGVPSIAFLSGPFPTENPF